MAHLAVGPQAKVLEAMWWWLDNDAALTAFVTDSTRRGVYHKYRLWNGEGMSGGNVMASECPALVIEPIGGDEQPITDLMQIPGGIEGIMEGKWSLTLIGYLNSLNFDEINTFYFLAMNALCAGFATLWAVPSQGLLQGNDQIIQHVTPRWINPGANWINPGDIDRSGNDPKITFFAFQFDLLLKTVTNRQVA